MVLGFLLIFILDAGMIGFIWYFEAYTIVFGILMVTLGWRLPTRRAHDHSQPAQVAA
ncbi:MAG: hypothetical protein KF722_15505 [Nitrospira sp.]|nr:hypothetical protein [Nitrospira sp.]